jgi:hypothetical protein
MQTVWLGPASFVTGDPTLRVSYSFVSHPADRLLHGHGGFLSGSRWACGCLPKRKSRGLSLPKLGVRNRSSSFGNTTAPADARTLISARVTLIKLRY